MNSIDSKTPVPVASKSLFELSAWEKINQIPSHEETIDRFIQYASPPEIKLPGLHADEFMRRYDQKSPGFFRTKNKPNGEIDACEFEIDQQQMLHDFLRLSPADQKKVLGWMDKPLPQFMKTLLQAKWIELQEEIQVPELLPRQAGENRFLIAQIELSLALPIFMKIDNGTQDFTRAMTTNHLSLAKTILSGRKKDSLSVRIEPHILVAGQIRKNPDRTTFVSQLEKELFQPLATIPEDLSLGSLNKEMGKHIHNKIEEDRKKLASASKRFTQLTNEVMAVIANARTASSTYQDLCRRFPGANVEIIGSVDDILYGYISCGEGMPVAMHVHYYYRVQTGTQEYFFTEMMVSAFSRKTLLIQSKQTTPPGEGVLSARIGKGGLWEIEIQNNGLSQKDAFELQAIRAARANMESFVQVGDDNVLNLLAQAPFGSAEDYFTRHFDIENFYDHKIPLEDSHQGINRQLQRIRDLLSSNSFASDDPEGDRLTLEQKVSLLEAVKEHIQSREIQQVYLEHVLEQKKLKHRNDWDLRQPLQQVSAFYVDAITGTQLEMPLFQGKMRNGKAFILDLRDGGVYSGKSIADAMHSFIKANEYGIGYMKYCLGQGKPVITSATFDGFDKFWKHSESIATYVGYSAIATMMIPSPDPFTKGYTAVAGLTSMTITAAASARRAVSDWWHERDIDPIDVIRVASASLSVASVTTGIISQTAQVTTKSLRTFQFTLAFMSLGADVAQAGIGISRLTQSLDLDNPHLTHEERRRRYGMLIAQAGVQAALVIFFNRKVITQSVRYVGQILVAGTELDVDSGDTSTNFTPQDGADDSNDPAKHPHPVTQVLDPALAAREKMYGEYVTKLKSEGKTEILSYDQLKAKALGYKVAVLGGYSGLGYEDPDAVKKYLEALMRRNGDQALYVIGGTADGIGEAYDWIPEIAKKLGFKNIKTAGIVSKNAAQYGIALQDYIVFVDTAIDNWEVKQDGHSLMVSAAQDTQGQMVYFKGGEVSQVEILEALKRNVPVTLFDDPAIAPNQAKVAKKLAKNPQMVVDGTQVFLSEPNQYPSLHVIKTDIHKFSEGLEALIKKLLKSKHFMLIDSPKDPPKDVSFHARDHQGSLYA